MKFFLTTNIISDSIEMIISGEIMPVICRVFSIIVLIHTILSFLRFVRRMMNVDVCSVSVVSSPTVRKEDADNVVLDDVTIEAYVEESEENDTEDKYEENNDFVEYFPKMVYALNCPNCGAPVKENSRKCAWCDSELRFARSRFGG